nr:hypothetical protein [Tanacetum cinerariifolium]
MCFKGQTLYGCYVILIMNWHESEKTTWPIVIRHESKKMAWPIMVRHAYVKMAWLSVRPKQTWLVKRVSLARRLVGRREIVVWHESEKMAWPIVERFESEKTAWPIMIRNADLWDDEEVEREPKVTKDKVKITSSKSTAHVQPLVVQVPILEPEVALKRNTKSSILYPSRLKDQKHCEKSNNQMLKDVEWEPIEEEHLEEPKEGWILGKSKKRVDVSSHLLSCAYVIEYKAEKVCHEEMVKMPLVDLKAEIGERKMIGLEMEQETTKVAMIKERLKEAKDRQERVKLIVGSQTFRI